MSASILIDLQGGFPSSRVTEADGEVHCGDALPSNHHGAHQVHTLVLLAVGGKNQAKAKGGRGRELGVYKVLRN
eukprot:scaffold16604_cov88-Skeletonema_marinoi.AAC.2